MAPGASRAGSKARGIASTSPSGRGSPPCSTARCSTVTTIRPCGSAPAAAHLSARTHKPLSDLWAEIGPRTLDLLRGSFAGLVYDPAERELTFFRDPIGVKPLFYAVRGGDYIVGTEAREVQKYLPERGEVDCEALVGLMLRCPSALDRRSPLRGVLRVPPGCLCRLRRTGSRLQLSVEPYWRPDRIPGVGPDLGGRGLRRAPPGC